MTDKPLDVGRYVDEAAAAIGLPIAAEHRAGVIANMERVVAMSRLVMDFPLSDEVEPAAVFRS